MNCKTLQQHLEQGLNDSLTASERRDLERHLAECPRCRELDALVRGDLEVFPVDPPADLTAAILKRTTGAACNRARDLLCDYVDVSLPAFDAELVRQHTAGCAGCRQIELTLHHLAEDLPAMAHLTPDSAFIEDVLASTRPQSARWSRRLAALVDAWNRLLERPRFGLEASYVGAIAIFALFGLSASPFADVPQQALKVVQYGPTTGVEETTQAVVNLQSQINEVSRRTWKSSTRRGADTVGHWTGGVSRSLQRTAQAREALRLHGGELGEAALRLDLEQTARAARGIGEGLGSLWREIKAAEEDNELQPTPGTGSDEC